MNYLLDTCVLSEFRKKVPEPKVLAWLELQDEDSLFLSVISIGETQKGISRLPASRRRNDLTTWLESVVYRYGDRVLPLDTEVIQAWGELSATLEQKGRVLPAADSFIAATAIFHDLVVVTRNEDDFKGTGVRIINVWN